MALDSNGIWQYEETDAEATASDLLNLGMGSVSARVGDLQDEVDAKQDEIGDTGWVNVTIGSGFAAQSGQTPQVRRIGSVIYARGGWGSAGIASANTGYDVGTIPAGFRPPRTSQAVATGSSAARFGRLEITPSTGNVRLLTGPDLSTYYLFSAGSAWTND